MLAIDGFVEGKGHIMKLFYSMTLGMLVAGLVAGAAPVQAQEQPSGGSSVQHAHAIAAVCPGAWESPACLTAVSRSNMDMVSNYGATLQQNRQDAAAETLKQHCAASTAHSEQQFPAYAMREAFVECANIISDLHDQTGFKLHQGHYQLLIAPIMCLDKNAQCRGYEQALQKYR